MDALTGKWPWAAVYAFFVLVALLRSHATYWAGRGLRAGGGRSRWAARLEGPAVARAERVVRRVGAPAVTLAFLTVGVQTAVMAAAGALRMPLSRFLPATAAGAVLWAAVYTTAGFAAVGAWLGRLSWWWPAATLAVLALLALASRALSRRWALRRPGRGR